MVVIDALSLERLLRQSSLFQHVMLPNNRDVGSASSRGCCQRSNPWKRDTLAAPFSTGPGSTFFFLTMFWQQSQYDSRLRFSYRVLVRVRVMVRLGLGLGLELVIGLLFGLWLWLGLRVRVRVNVMVRVTVGFMVRVGVKFKP